MRLGISCQPSAGGSGIMATELGIAMARRGHQVHFVTSDRPFRLAEFHTNVVCHTVDVSTYPLFRDPPMSLALASRICDVAEEHDIEIWHAHYAIPNATCALLAREMLPPEKRFKVVTTLHGTDITLVGSAPSFYRITKHTMEASDAVTAVSDWLRRETEREFELTRPVQTIYNFLDDEKFPPVSPERCTLADEDEKIVMHISNFRPVKRVTDVVRVFNKIVERVNAILVMVGDGPELMSAVRVAKQLGIHDRIKYLGTAEHIETIMPCADLIIQPSEQESFGLVPLEAMSCEVPVIGTNSGGVVEVVEHGVTGYLAEVGDIDTMARYAIEILTNQSLAKEMGRQGAIRARAKFAKNDIVDQYEEVYASLIGAATTS